MQGSRPGDKRVRVARVRPVEVHIERARRVRRPRSPSAVLVLSFAILIAVGSILLALPISSASGSWTAPLDAVFASTSAVCVTGLALVDTGTYWSGFGQLVLLVLMQLGGFGFMTGSTLLLFLLVGRRTALRDRMLAQASTGVTDLGSVRSVVGRVAVFTIVAEVAGAIVLSLVFIVGGHAGDVVQGIWWGIFHAISAFNNGGIDLFGDFKSLADYVDEPLVLGSLGVLDPAGQPGLRHRRRHRGQAALEPAGPGDPGGGPHDAGHPARRHALDRASWSGRTRRRSARCPSRPGRSTPCSRPRPCGRPASAPCPRSSCATRPCSS